MTAILCDAEKNQFVTQLKSFELVDELKFSKN